MKIDLKKVPYLSIPDAPIAMSAQEFLPIADITDDIVLYKDGGAALVMETTSLNFSLLSEKEQEAVIAAYAALLNSLSFSIQIMVRSQRKDISSYINYMDGEIKKISNTKLAPLAAEYKRFIVEGVKKKNVLGKRFFVALPFSALELGVGKSVASAIRRKGPLPFPKDYVIKKAKVTLYPRRDHLIRQAGRLGIKLRQLTTDELINLYFAVFNPEPPAVKKDGLL